MTYLIFGNRRAYLSSIIDLYDMRIVAYVISRHNDNKLVMDTLAEEWIDFYNTERIRIKKK